MNLATWLDAAAIAAYATLLLELTVFPIPSEASTWQLLAARGDGATTPGAAALQRVHATARSHRVLTLLLPTALGVLAWLVPLLLVVLPSWRPALSMPMPDAVVVAGIVAIGLGRAITFGSVLQLRAAKRHERLPGGLFRNSRNPGLVGMYVCYLGLMLGYGLPLLAVVLPLYLGNMHRRVRLEEAQLDFAHGASWRDYAARVPRYLPFPGLR
jgi:protein-S-isoprenylcysteine O-methyltransferase Ste14